MNANLVEVEVNWDIAEQQSLIFGMSYEERQEQGEYFATGFTLEQLHGKLSDLDNIDNIDNFPRLDSEN